MKPSVFIASSSEGLDIAYAIQENLEAVADPTVWDQNVFELSSYALESLLTALDKYNFGVFVFSSDDVVKIRDQTYVTARDNVVFELGLFIGRLGRERNFIFIPRDTPEFRLATDLLGVMVARYPSDRADKNWKAAVAPACNGVRRSIDKFVASESALSSVPHTASVTTPGKPQVSIDLPEQFMIGHGGGNPQILAYLELSNTGGVTASISKIACILRHERGTQWNMTAQSYQSRQASVQPGQPVPEYPIMRIVLKPGDSWTENVRFYKMWSPERLRESNELISKFRKNIDTKRAQLVSQYQLVEVDQELYAEMMTFFKSQFDLVPGTYLGLFAALGEGNQVLGVRGISFQLGDSSLDALRTATFDGYKYGAGVCYPNNDPNYAIWTPRVYIDDAKAREAFDKLTEPEVEMPKSNVT